MKGRIAVIILMISVLLIVGVTVESYAYHGKGKDCKTQISGVRAETPPGRDMLKSDRHITGWVLCVI